MFKSIVLTFIILLILLSNSTQCISQKVKKQKNVDIEKTMLLGSIGSLTSSNLYLSYLSLTFIKEELKNNLIKSDAEKLISSIQNSLILMKEDLKKLKQTVRLSPNDITFLDQLSDIYSSMLDDVSLLEIYRKSKDNLDLEKFENTHKAAQKEMQSLFGDDKK